MMALTSAFENYAASSEKTIGCHCLLIPELKHIRLAGWMIASLAVIT
jgi:hypothetical protein